ncbi:MAG: gliding motility-associated C-terminal domain-containing protein [Crocinitomicaceae bacterium]|nr:gliding motility-associated C-terminal domain-containing protein [Crocinitomicaceae bacterium]
MKTGFLTVLFWCIATVGFSQEIEHAHSLHHLFLENKGQWDDQILFKNKFNGGNLWIQQKKMVFHLQDYSSMEEAHINQSRLKNERPLRQTVLHLNFLEANEVTEVIKTIESEEYYNYFLGNDESKWASNVHGYGEAILKDLYTGIDLKLIEQREEMKYEFHVAPTMDPSIIQLQYAGQDEIYIDKKGNLVIETSLGKIIEQKPYAYQIVNGNVREVECEFAIEDDIVIFDLGEYNQGVTLIIDPVLIFATYCGSVTDNFGMTATYGYDGTAFSGGMIYGNAYPTPLGTAYDINSNFSLPTGPTYGITDAFVSRYSADGTNMIWTTFIGGGDDFQGTETAQSMICDEFNNLYLYGATSSTDFPIQGGYQSTHAGGQDSLDFYQNGVHFKDQGTDIYVVKISSNGQNLLGSTYFGGSDNDGVNYKRNMTYYTFGTYAQFSEYDSLTTNYGDQFRGEIMLDTAGNCIVASCTWSGDFPTQNAFQGTNAGMQDGVIFRLSNDLANLQMSSYYGGTNNDACYSVKVDSSGSIVVAGGTCSDDLTDMASGWQPVYNGGTSDGFVIRLDPSGSSITEGSYIGTVNYDQSFFVEIDRGNNVYLVGQSTGGAFPVINAGFVNPGSGQYVVKLDSTLSTVVNSTVFGDGNPQFDISPSAFLVDICGNIYISGWGAHLLQGVDQLANMPITADAFQSTAPNGFDFYLLVIERDMADTLYGSYLGGSDANEHVDGGTSRFDKNGVVYQSVCGGCGGNSDFPTTPGVWSDSNYSTNCNNLIFKFDFELIPNAEFTVDDNMGCAPFTVTFDNISTDSDSYLWDFGNGDTTSVIFEPVITFDTAGVYTISLYVTDSICLITDTATITITVNNSIDLSTIPDQELCIPTPIDFIAYANGIPSQYVWSSNINFTDTLNTNLADSIFTTTPTGPMTYYVNASNSGCSGIDSVVVDFIGSALVLSGNDSICAGEITTITATNSNPLITFTYEWEPDSIIVTPSVGNTVTVDPVTTQYVVVTASSSNGCVVSDSILINVGNIPDGIVQATASEYNVPEGSEVTLFGEPSGYAYQWLPAGGVDSPTSQQTQATVDNTTLFTLVVTDGICTKSDTVLVKTFTFICGEPYIYIPNAFSPNGDNENDILFVRGHVFEKMLFRVFDRWGEMVFESTDRSIGWDGTFRGKQLDPDVYDYYLEVTCIDDLTSIIKGNITLLK